MKRRKNNISVIKELASNRYVQSSRGEFKQKRIKDLYRFDRPREKIEKYGVEKLENYELLATLLRTGNSKKSAVMLAKEIILFFGEKLPTSGIKDLTSIKGIGLAKAAEIVACFELGKRYHENKKTTLLLSPKDIWNRMQDIVLQKKEHFIAFFLDSRNQEIKRETISIGSVSESLVHPREVFEPAIKYLSNSIILAHNHPTNILEPSLEDINITNQLIRAGKILDIKILDHIIVGVNTWCSMKENGYM